MRQTDVVALFDYNYWANRQALAMAAGIPHEQFTAPSDSTWRNIRGTLVHILDVERSWRGRLRGEPREAWDDTLSYEDYPTAAALEEHWSRDEAEMRSWLEGLDDTANGSDHRPGRQGSFSDVVLPGARAHTWHASTTRRRPSRSRTRASLRGRSTSSTTATG